MRKKHVPFISLLKEIMRLKRRKPSQLAADLDFSHATVSRWLTGEDIPNTRSCRKLAEYSGFPLEKVLFATGHIPIIAKTEPAQWPEWREYAQRKYANELDEDLITMIEDFIEHKRSKKLRRARKP